MAKFVRIFTQNILHQQSCFGTSLRHISTAPKIKSVTEILKAKHEGQVKVQGWVEGIRKMKTLIFVDIHDGSDLKKLQLTLNKDVAPPDLSFGSSVCAVGSMKVNQSGLPELIVEEIKVLGSCPSTSEGYPLAARQPYNSNHLRQNLSLRLRAPPFRALLRVRHRAHALLHSILDAQDFLLVHPPLLTSNDCESSGEVFRVQPDCQQLIAEMRSADAKVNANVKDEEVFFKHKAFLTVSGQLHLEAAARALNRVYCFGPIFRAENSKSRLHLSEFYMLEAELAFVDGIENITKIIERVMKRLIRGLLDSCSEDILLYRKLTNRPTEPDWLDHLDQMVLQAFNTVTYQDAMQMLMESDEKFKSRPVDGQSLSKEHELYLVKRNNNLPLFVVEWPQDIKPFYVRPCRGVQGKVEAVDLLCPIVGEVCGGSVREDDLSRLKLKLSDSELSQKLDWYLQLRRFGNVTTGGFGAGFERIIQLVLGTTNIKDTIPFPRWPHNCQL
ncbi:probable asparagine--tRNA ligase, mitochondrial [Nilaparvata lugens]|uniref:probable asparagine--tRNA ligase, mitochondrial n=1 Tax=Nilaparvata lugens TaxID=108931 RepID=UPI00193CE60A|nr:probable asparagine--tRNA ligase, mitochondrial [Nilaparvata lugens]